LFRYGSEAEIVVLTDQSLLHARKQNSNHQIFRGQFVRLTARRGRSTSLDCELEIPSDRVESQKWEHLGETQTMVVLVTSRHVPRALFAMYRQGRLALAEGTREIAGSRDKLCFRRWGRSSKVLNLLAPLVSQILAVPH